MITDKLLNLVICCCVFHSPESSGQSSVGSHAESSTSPVAAAQVHHLKLANFPILVMKHGGKHLYNAIVSMQCCANVCFNVA